METDTDIIHFLPKFVGLGLIGAVIQISSRICYAIIIKRVIIMPLS